MKNRHYSFFPSINSKNSFSILLPNALLFLFSVQGKYFKLLQRGLTLCIGQSWKKLLGVAQGHSFTSVISSYLNMCAKYYAVFCMSWELWTIHSKNRTTFGSSGFLAVIFRIYNFFEHVKTRNLLSFLISQRGF